MKGFNLYRMTMGYLGVVFLLCAMVVYKPLTWIWPAQSASDMTEVAGLALISDTRSGFAKAQIGNPDPRRVVGLRVDANGDLGATADAIVASLAATAPDAGVGTARNDGDVALPLTTNDATLQGLVAQALREGQSDADIDALVNRVAGQGAVSVPAMLVTSDGRVDTAVLLASVVARSNGIELGEGDVGSQADTALSPEAALVAAGSDVAYTVGAGDSLGSLALRFYGDSALFPLIFDANRGLMASPDKLHVGQVLIIPGQG